MFKTGLSEFDGRVWNFTKNWTVVRLIGEMTSVYEFWIPISTETGQKCVRNLCLDWDAATHSHADTCLYCKAGLRGRPMYYSNAIIRQLQATETAATSSTLPVRVLKIPPRLHQGLKNLASLNKRLSKNSGKWKQYGLAHPKCGSDVRIKINPATPYSYYDLQLWNGSRLSAEELAYPVVPLVIKPESPEQAKAAWKKLKTIIVHTEKPT